MKFVAYFKGQDLELSSTSLEEALKRGRAIERAVTELGKLVAVEEVSETKFDALEEDYESKC